MNGEVLRADQQAQLLVTTFVNSQQSPEIWDSFVDRMFGQWERDANREHLERLGTIGRPAATDATQPSNGTATANHVAPPVQQPSGDTQAGGG